ncbi:MAG: Rnase Y domain-containing protein, partial [Planctomycetota bacterium]
MMQDNLVALATATPAANTAGTELPSLLLVGGGAAVVGIAIGAFAALLIGAGRAKRSKAEAERLVEDAKAEARREADATKLEAERQALVRKEKADAEFEAARTELRETERRLGKREDLLDRKEQKLADREQRLDERSAKADARAKEADDRFEQAESLVDQQTETLQRLSSLDADRARELLLERVEERERDAVGKRVREINEQAEEQAREKAREITLQAIQRFAAETTSESTVRAVAIPSDEMKGRIIGREGRNIRAIEKSTGADIIVDDTPGVIVVSCFDKVRQATAVEALERLIGDGRLHPTRIEEVVEKVRAEVAERVIKFGKEAAAEAGVR